MGTIKVRKSGYDLIYIQYVSEIEANTTYMLCQQKAIFPSFENGECMTLICINVYGRFQGCEAKNFWANSGPRNEKKK